MHSTALMLRSATSLSGAEDRDPTARAAMAAFRRFGAVIVFYFLIRIELTNNKLCLKRYDMCPILRLTWLISRVGLFFLAVSAARVSGRRSLAASQAWTLDGINYGLNHVYTSGENNNININMGEATANCSGLDCTTSFSITQSVQRSGRLDARAGTDTGGLTILNLHNRNDIWEKSGRGSTQCVEDQCDSSFSSAATYGATTKAATTKATPQPYFRILLSNITLGEGNIINIGAYSESTLNIGDGAAQCVGRNCTSGANKAWKNKAKVLSFLPQRQDLRAESDCSAVAKEKCKQLTGTRRSWCIGREKKRCSAAFDISLTNLTLGLGNIINIGDDNRISINIGDGASQCIGDSCSSTASKITDYSPASPDGTAPARESEVYNGVIEGSPDYPYTLVFRNVQWGEGNVVNIGSFNRNGLAVGDGVTQCFGDGCTSSTTTEVLISDNVEDNVEGNGSNRSIIGSNGSNGSLPLDSNGPPLSLSNLFMGEGNILNFGRENTLSINIGDGCSQCVGEYCTSTAIKAGDFGSLPPSDGGGGGGNNDPMAPSDIDGEVKSSTSMSVTWKDADASPPDVSYTVNCVPGTDTACSDKGVEVKGIKPKIEKAVVNGLQAGTAYECWVALESQILSEHCSQTSVALTTTS